MYGSTKDLLKESMKDLKEDVMPAIIKGYADGQIGKEKANNDLDVIYRAFEGLIPQDRGDLFSELNKTYKNHKELLEKVTERKKAHIAVA